MSKMKYELEVSEHTSQRDVTEKHHRARPWIRKKTDHHLRSVRFRL